VIFAVFCPGSTCKQQPKLRSTVKQIGNVMAIGLIPVAHTVIAQLLSWFKQCNTLHPLE
jgi:hypothetical protein